jgi:hypothetical protein
MNLFFFFSSKQQQKKNSLLFSFKILTVEGVHYLHIYGVYTWRTSALSYPCIMLITPFQNNKWKQHIQSSHQRDWLDPIFSHEHTQKKEEVDKMWGRERGVGFSFPFILYIYRLGV